MAADIRKLVADGHIDLDSLMEGRWISYVAVARYNGDRNEEETHSVRLERAEAYGITAWRWADYVFDETGAHIYDRGGPMLSRAECLREAKAYAASEHREVGK